MSCPQQTFCKSHYTIKYNSGHRYCLVGNSPFLGGGSVELTQRIALPFAAQLLSRRNSAERHVWALMIVSPEPFSRCVLSPLDRSKKILPKPLVANGSVVALDVGILLGLARMDVLDENSSRLSPRQERAADQFWVVVHPNGQGLASSLDDAIQRPHHPLRRHRDVCFDAQPFTLRICK